MFLSSSRWALALAASAGMAPYAFGGGFHVPTQSARAAGQADAFTAQADDPSAIHYNPAGLTQLQGTQLSAGLYSVFPYFRFEGESGEENNNEPAYLPHFYLASDLGQEDWRAGLGVNMAFGLREDWGEHGSLRQVVTHADLAVLNIAPALAYRINESLSIGAALNVYYGRVELNSAVPFPAGPEGDFRIEGEGFAVGATLGML